MKTLKLTIGILAFILITFTACKKEKNNPEQENTAVTPEDLLDYQMVWLLQSPDKILNLRMLYFNKVGNEVKATLDGLTSRVIKPVKLENNTFKFDLNDNGSVVYTIELLKKDGVLSIASSKFYNINNPNYKATPAIIEKTSRFVSVKNKTFKNAENSIINFNDNTWRYSKYPNMSGNFYECGIGGWKGRINGVDYMGVNMDNKEGKYMVIEQFGETEAFALY